jgi:predicted peroxiredoxin
MRRGLTIIVTSRDPERLRAGLTLAAANAALEGRTRLFVQGEAVEPLAPWARVPNDADHAEAGLPTLAQLIEEALGLGVEIIACQSGLALMRLPADALDSRIGFGGPVSVLQTLGEDRLVTL